MDVFQALHQRRSVRAFLPQTPSADTVRSLMALAARSASGGNLQPWRVLALTGEPLAHVVVAVAQAEPELEANQTSYPASLWEPYRTRRFANGEDLYRSIGIAREDKAGRLERRPAHGPGTVGGPWHLPAVTDAGGGGPGLGDLCPRILAPL